MKKVVLKILLIVVLFLGLNRLVANAAVTGTSANIKPGEQATITIKSDKKLGCFELALTDLGGLEFVTSSGASGSSGNGSKVIAYASAEGTTTMATFTVKAPANATAKTYNLKFSATNMDDPQEKGSVPASASVTANVTVKKEETTPPPSNENSGENTSGNGNTSGGGNTSGNGNNSEGGNTSGNGNTSGGSNTSSGGSNTGSGSNTSPEPKPETKSSNANLKMIVTDPVDFSGFKPSQTSGYEVTVDNNVDRIEFVTTKEDDGADLSKWVNKANSDTGYKWVYLAEGRNEISVTVTAEDGTTKKTYTVVVNRLAKEDSKPNNEEENPNEKENQNEGEKPTEEKELALTSLSIDGIKLSPTFKTDVYEYKAKLNDVTVKNLKVDAKANIERATVEVTGNENLVEGENTITILVKYEDKSATYQITVTKEAKVAEAGTKTNTLSNTTETGATAENKETGGVILPIIIGIVGIIILAAVIALIVTKIKFRKNDGVDLNFIDDIENDNNNSSKVRIRQNGENKIEVEDDDLDSDNNKGRERRGRHF